MLYFWIFKAHSHFLNHHIWAFRVEVKQIARIMEPRCGHLVKTLPYKVRSFWNNVVPKTMSAVLWQSNFKVGWLPCIEEEGRRVS